MSQNIGKVVEIIGPVVDIQFSQNNLRPRQEQHRPAGGHHGLERAAEQPARHGQHQGEEQQQQHQTGSVGRPAGTLLALHGASSFPEHHLPQPMHPLRRLCTGAKCGTLKGNDTEDFLC